MPKYEITVDGSNFLVQFHASQPRRKHGFYTKFFLEADTPEAAEAAAIEHLHSDEDILSVMRNEPGDDAKLKIENVVEIARWPKTAWPRIGLVWYPDDAQPQGALKKAPQTKPRRTLTKRCS